MATSEPQAGTTVTARPHPAQEAFIADESPETAYVGGVGSGKTAGGAIRVGRHVSEWNPGSMGVVVSPTVPMMRNAIIPELRKWGLLDKPGIEFKRSENRIEYPNGSVVVLESANNERKIERLRAMNLAWAWIDEAAYLPEKVYRILNDRLRVGDYRNLFVTTTPRGFNWVYDEFADLEDAEEESVADGRILRTGTTTSVVGVSTRSNPGNPEDYIERQERQRSGEGYDQEIEGEFVNFEGLVYDWFDDDNLVDELPEDYDEVIYGVDWGHNNPAVILAILRDGEDWFVADEWYERRCTTGDQARAAEEFVEEYGQGRIYCDPAEPSNIHEFRRDYGLPATEANNDVSPGIRKVTEHREHLYVARGCQNVRNEFSQYQYKDGGDSDDPLKQNDHAMDALRYALFTHTPRDPGAGPDEDDTGGAYGI